MTPHSEPEKRPLRPDPRFHAVGVITNGIGNSSTYHLNLTRSLPSVRIVDGRAVEPVRGKAPYAGKSRS